MECNEFKNRLIDNVAMKRVELECRACSFYRLVLPVCLHSTRALILISLSTLTKMIFHHDFIPGFNFKIAIL